MVLVIAIAKSKRNLFTIQFKSEKERQKISITIVGRMITLEKAIKKERADAKNNMITLQVSIEKSLILLV